MSQENYITEILGIKDAEIEKVEQEGREIRIRFRKQRTGMKCPHCGEYTNDVHDYRIKELRDIPIQGKAVRLEYRRRRYVCRRCGHKIAEPFELAGKNQRTTARLAVYGLGLSKERRSGKSIAKELGVSASSVNRWLKHVPRFRPTELPRVLSIDEFRGNAGGERFQCILTAPEEKKIVDILPDRSVCTIQDYLKSFSNRGDVAYFVMDMNRGYRDIARTIFPKAKIVIDRFHYVRYGVWAFENVRKRVQKSLNPHQRKYFKRSRKLLLARASRLSTEDRQAVEVMLSHSEDLTRAWLLKEEFFKFVDARSSCDAKGALDRFRHFARQLHLPEFRECLRMLNNWEEYILNSFDCPYSNGFTEGINNSIKVLKRATFGMPNFQNFRARILYCNSFYP